LIVAINESSLLGLGRPSYSAIANSVRLAVLVVGLPISLSYAGLPGGVICLTAVEVFRYIPIYLGQRRERFAFARQDFAITLAMFAMIGPWEWLRWALGFGTSLEAFSGIFPR
jgi:hypothetical protein